MCVYVCVVHVCVCGEGEMGESSGMVLVMAYIDLGSGHGCL